MSWAEIAASVDRHLAGRPIAFTRNPLFRAPSGGLPNSGVVPRGRNDELEMDRPGRPRSRAAAARSDAEFWAGRRKCLPRPYGPAGRGVSVGRRHRRVAAIADRGQGEPCQRRAGGSVKLASYGPGPTRAAALLGYHSPHGELTLERQDGTMVPTPGPMRTRTRRPGSPS